MSNASQDSVSNKSGATMEAPSSIASLPRPLDSTHGRIQAAPVYGFRESRKGKRHEVAIGVDGEGVNVYNVTLAKQHQAVSTTNIGPRFNLKDSSHPMLFLLRLTYAVHHVQSTYERPQLRRLNEGPISLSRMDQMIVSDS